MKKSNLFFALTLIITSILFFSCQKENSFTNNPPVIEDQQFSVKENASNEMLVDTVKATDSDKKQILKYYIISGNFNDAFRIDLFTGLLYVNNSSVLDYEKVKSFELMVEVADDYKMSLSAKAKVTIAINDSAEFLLPILH